MRSATQAKRTLRRVSIHISPRSHQNQYTLGRTNCCNAGNAIGLGGLDGPTSSPPHTYNVPELLFYFRIPGTIRQKVSVRAAKQPRKRAVARNICCLRGLAPVPCPAWTTRRSWLQGHVKCDSWWLLCVASVGRRPQGARLEVPASTCSRFPRSTSRSDVGNLCGQPRLSVPGTCPSAHERTRNAPARCTVHTPRRDSSSARRPWRRLSPHRSCRA